MTFKRRIDRTFLRSLQATGSYQEYADPDCMGLAVKVSPGGRISFTLRFRKTDGKQSRKTLGYFPSMTITDARRLALETLSVTERHNESDVVRLEKRRRRAEQSQQLKESITLREFIDGPFRHWKETEQSSGKKALQLIERKFADWLDLPMVDLTQKMVEIWRSGRLKTVQKATAARELNTLKGVYSKALEWGEIHANPLQSVKATGSSDPITRYLSEEEDEALLKALDEREQEIRQERRTANAWRRERNYPLLVDLDALTYADYLKPAVLLAKNTGMRRGEMLALMWSDIDLERRFIYVRSATAKGEKHRKIPLNMTATEMLTHWKKQAHPKYVFSIENDEPLKDLKKSWAGVVKRAKIENFRWHDLRHDFASQLVMSGVDLNTVRELLGHGSIATTLRYAHLAPEHKSAAVAKLDRKPSVVHMKAQEQSAEMASVN